MAIFESIFDFLDKIVQDFSWRRLITFFLFLFLLGAGFVLFEEYTNTFHLSRLERSVALMKELRALRDSVSSDSSLAGIYSGMRNDLDVLVNKRSFGPSISPIVWRGLAGSAPWILTILAFLPGVRRGQTDNSIIRGGIVFVVLFGGIGMLLPDSWGPNINYIVYPIGHYVVVASIFAILAATKKKVS
jgi:hypothetical protein